MKSVSPGQSAHRLPQCGGGATTQLLPASGGSSSALQNEISGDFAAVCGGRATRPVAKSSPRQRRGQQHGQRGQFRVTRLKPTPPLSSYQVSASVSGGQATRPAALGPRSAGDSETRPAGAIHAVSGGFGNTASGSKVLQSAGGSATRPASSGLRSAGGVTLLKIPRMAGRRDRKAMRSFVGRL